MLVLISSKLGKSSMDVKTNMFDHECEAFFTKLASHPDKDGCGPHVTDFRPDTTDFWKNLVMLLEDINPPGWLN